MKTITANTLSIYPLSEGAVTIEFGNIIDEAVIARIRSFDSMLQQNPFPGMYSTVPAYATLTIFYNPEALIAINELPGKSCFDKVSTYVNQLKESIVSSAIESEPISIPVCYGGAFGPDLEFVAEYHHITANEVVRLHSSAIYKVYMIGFVPGFAYMGGLTDMLDTPRKATPAKAIPAGAVGVAGKQTGIYPHETPGGWQIIGQTPVKLFDAARERPSLLKAGDKIKFEPIKESNFKSYTKRVPPEEVRGQ